MKTLTLGLLLLMLVLGFRGAGAAPPAPTPGAPLVGTVLEVKEVAPYSYLRLRTKEGEVWAAVPTAPVKVGADVTIASPQVMSGFHSKSLNRTFDRIVFGTLGGREAQASAPGMAAKHAGAGKGAAVPATKVEKAKGPNAQTVAGIVTGAASLKDKPVTVRGQVVKFTADVMGKNWLHLRDGTGSATDGSDDLLIVTGDKANVGDVVLIKGTVRTDRNLGSGYSYKVLVEDATLTK
jgi:uncharacterized protein YdeI (BOF family)